MLALTNCVAGISRRFAASGAVNADPGRLAQALVTGKTRAHHRADTLARQLIHLHIRRPRRFGEPQRGVHPAAARVQFTFAGGQLQAQFWQLAVEPVQARNKPARQQAARAGQHKRRIGLPLLQFGAGAAQAVEQFGADIAQTNARICEFKATTFLAEQGHAQVLFQAAHLPADCAMSDVQFVSCLADAVQSGSGFEGTQGIKWRKVLVHL